jgi:predicted Zn-dependent peptidase
VVATPGARAATARRTVSGALAALDADLDPEAVQAAARAVRRDLLFFGRTPERMAEVIGSFADRTGESDAAQRFFGLLDRVDEETVRRVLSELRASEVVTLEVAPQRLVPN